MRGSGVFSASSGEYTAFSGSYSTRTFIAASNAASSLVAATAATGSPTNRTRSIASACSSCETGRIPKGTGIALPRRTATTPGTRSASLVSTRTILACATWLRWSFAKSMRGSARSSANRVAPAHFASPSTLRGDLPISARARGARSPATICLPRGGRLAGGVARRGLDRALDRGELLAAQLRGGALHGLEDLEVARAPAEVAREALADLVARRGRRVVEQGLRRAEEPRRAVAALGGVQIRERLLERVRSRRPREPLDRRDLAPLALEAEEQAREDRHAVDDHRARAALAQFAPVLRAREPEVLAEHLEERLVRAERDLLLLPVHADREAHLLAACRA